MTSLMNWFFRNFQVLIVICLVFSFLTSPVLLLLGYPKLARYILIWIERMLFTGLGVGFIALLSFFIIFPTDTKLPPIAISIGVIAAMSILGFSVIKLIQNYQQFIVREESFYSLPLMLTTGIFTCAAIALLFVPISVRLTWAILLICISFPVLKKIIG